MTVLERTGPFDVVVALRLTSPAGTLVEIADELGVVPSQVHAAIRRLAASGLLRPGVRATNPRALTEFLVHGIRYAFPAVKGPLALGVPTAYSAPPLSTEVDAIDVVVWPAARHPAAVQGFSIAPLYKAAPKLIERSPATYRLLAVTDALRLAEPRTRLSARDRLVQLVAGR